MATKYLRFPVALLRDVYNDCRGTMERIQAIGILNDARLHNDDSYNGFIKAAIALGIALDDPLAWYELAKAITNSIEGETTAMVNKEIVLDYYRNHATKSEFDAACFACFAAIKSIMGKKEWCKATRAFITARMFGDNKGSEPQAGNERLRAWYGGDPRHLRKVLNRLQLDWHLKLFANHCRGYFLSFKLNQTSLAIVSLKSKEKARLKALSDDKKRALEIAERLQQQQQEKPPSDGKDINRDVSP